MGHMASNLVNMSIELIMDKFTEMEIVGIGG